MDQPEPMNWFVLLDLLVPFGAVICGLLWYDLKLRRARRRTSLDQAAQEHD
jgi:hypothetical protein